MDSCESKKLALIRIWQIFKEYSDFNHPLTQEDIARRLEHDYGIVIERKAISRNISLLKEAGVEIESGRAGSYLSCRDFEDAELRLLIDGVLSSKFITAKHSKSLINRLCTLSNTYFKPSVKHIYSVDNWNKTDNKELFLNIEIIGDAIERNRQIAFNTGRYGMDKKIHKGYRFTGTPCAMLLNDQQYFLLFIWNLNEDDESEKLEYIAITCPMEEIMDVKILEDKIGIDPTRVEAFKNGMDIPKFLNEYSVRKDGIVFDDSSKVERVTFVCPETYIESAIRTFGHDIRILKAAPLECEELEDDVVWSLSLKKDNPVKISVKTTKYGALDFVLEKKYAIVISPPYIKEYVRHEIEHLNTIQQALSKAVE